MSRRRMVEIILLVLFVELFSFSYGQEPEKQLKEPVIENENFALEVKLKLAHKIPNNYTDGVWVSSVPMKLDVFIFPKTFVGNQLDYIKKVDKSQNADPYYMGKTPLYVKLKKGKYEIVVVHPPLSEKDPTYKEEFYETKEKMTLPSLQNAKPIDKIITIRHPVNPFIGPNLDAIIMGRSFWCRSETIEIGTELKTMIALFQRKDQDISHLLSELPEEKSFDFTMVENLKDFSKFLPSGMSGGIPDNQISKALELIHRGGVLGWIGKGDIPFYIEIIGNNNSFIVHYQ